ncbi:MAG: arsenate reductase ArsC [Candidatus Latescibacteria bacterium]|jgi:arsenate reductase|nr:arsenate reductase ArsC [Candidatus Latescibacterota bacterium]MDP7267910.1 arsenate reductase ArsC [Pirellulales bacterium]HJN65269.1 arsenate reductase ArsC [Pirellulales bacterium]
MLNKLNILFLCTGNSCRSQMAEGWTRSMLGEMVDAYSAGIEKKGLNPHAVRVMQEVGIDISAQQSKTLEELGEIPFDFVVTVCGNADANCPSWPDAVTVLHAPFDDPPHLAADAASDEEALKHYRRVRDEIAAFVETIPEKLAAGGDGDD